MGAGQLGASQSNGKLNSADCQLNLDLRRIS